jgi:hypothetical protein
MIRFTKTVTRRATDGSEIRIPEGALAVKDPDCWRFLSPRPLITKRLAFDSNIECVTIRLKQASLPIKTPEEEDRVLVFRRKGSTLFVTLENKLVDVTTRASVPICKGLERKISHGGIPVRYESTVKAITSKVGASWDRVPTIKHFHRNKEFYGLEFTVDRAFDTTVASLQKIVMRNSKLVRRINWGLRGSKLTFQLWFRKVGTQQMEN